MRSEREEERDRFIENVQELILEATGILPSFEQVDGFAGERPGSFKPTRPPWMDMIQKSEGFMKPAPPAWMDAIQVNEGFIKRN